MSSTFIGGLQRSYRTLDGVLRPLIEKFAKHPHNLLKLIQKILKELPITQIARSEHRFAFVLKNEILQAIAQEASHLSLA